VGRGADGGERGGAKGRCGKCVDGIKWEKYVGIKGGKGWVGGKG